MAENREPKWTDCHQCGGGGYIEGDCTCMDDTCCCLEPEPPVCGLCRGNGGWHQARGYREMPEVANG